ncbi:winged helix-turn-helix transcriptional regulator [Streptomyces sp. NPDC003631]|jgi:DNA-binding HxlR family transcriptional regulator|uniref:Helix-turn-helix domain-containing protein n=1 Tax=Streptomyces lannensis TaxID=766498 RepID=A0ABP7K5K0_9ACTN|nr:MULTISPECIES: helix-turn-helix domain-containing protein [unclassified Streptomyces]MEE1671041.1 helix-turn-helix domain-containing protein [Streptomyces sp. WAC07094]KUJ58170.1 transcriptional regulator [Streptomyces sp. NRRL F-5122]MBW8706315.1 HTH-type transcriptional regulator YodB [Streptomyces sp. MBT84]MDX3258377.1 helix-turn-helix domain-containing protein [Streptomyces sp. MI02-2A]REE58217.1 HxlR family transcriptional regulator [Streptomyces sp. 3212.3]
MAAQGHDVAACKQVDGGITRVFQLLGKRWSGPIVAVLVDQPAHFADLRRAIPGLSERMLSDRLAELGAAGLVVREVDEGPPLRVSYRLTESGAALEPALKALGQWAQTHLPDAEPCMGATETCVESARK